MLLIAKACLLGLVAVLIARLVGWLGLGESCTLSGEREAIRIAHLAQYGFRGKSVIMDEDGHSAIVEDSDNQHILVRRLGNRFVTRSIENLVEFDSRHNRISLSMPELGLNRVSFTVRESTISCVLDMLERINERVSKSN